MKFYFLFVVSVYCNLYMYYGNIQNMYQSNTVVFRQ